MEFFESLYKGFEAEHYVAGNAESGVTSSYVMKFIPRGHP
jgi:hypothetical protein